MSEFNIEDLDAVISEAKSSLVQMLALQLKKQLKHGAELAVQLANAERKCRELDARDVNLPKRSVGEVMHMSGFSRDYAEGWCAGNDNAIHEIRAAGIGVKGE
ncbi:hypothetical protein [Citrobacter meridianamericanus]|uniref:hypothetical protein n=1 Tax=Citrobacter meridianamericanus TaxID=2894201 RepID=UPI003B8A8B0F